MISRIFNKALHGLIKMGFSYYVRGKKHGEEKQALTSSTEVVKYHFESFNIANHINRNSLEKALDLLGNKSAVILETGSSAWGTNSSKLFDLYIKSFGGEFHTVDIRIEPLLKLYKTSSANSYFYCNDSVNFLKKWVKDNPNKKVDFVYLDSWDVDFKDPLPSAIHGLTEFFAIRPALQKGTVLVIDDSPNSLDNIDFLDYNSKEFARKYYSQNGIMPGKGSLVDLVLAKEPNVRKILHEYQIVYEFI